MHTPRKLADLLDKRLQAWRSIFLQHDLDLVADEELDGLWERDLRLSDKYVVRVSYAVGDVLAARGRLLDMLGMVEQCWPNRIYWCETRRQTSSTAIILGGIRRALIRSPEMQNKLVLEDLTRTLTEPSGLASDDETTIPELEVLYQYRDAKARLMALRELDVSYIREEQIDKMALQAAEKHPTIGKESLELLFREYIFNEKLFSWEHFSSMSKRYPFIYRSANLTDFTADESIRDNLQTAISNLAFGQETEDVLQIVARVALFIQVFGYDRFRHDVLQDGGQWGSSSGIGSRQRINLVPRRRSRACHPIVMGLATGQNKRSKNSLQNVMKGMIAHIREFFEETKIAVLITDIWDKEVFLETFEELSSYRRHGKKFLFLLVNGKKLIPMDYSFS